MRIVVCGSMTNYVKMLDLKDRLESFDHQVVLPDPDNDKHLLAIKQNRYEDTYKLKRKYDYIRKHYNNILGSDCILIANWNKNGIENYIGGNAFLEMGFAFILKKPIYLLNPIPQIDYYYHEMKAMDCRVLMGNLEKIF